MSSTYTIECFNGYGFVWFVDDRLLHTYYQVVLYFTDVKEGGETVFTKAPGIDHHLLPDTRVPVREVKTNSCVALVGRALISCWTLF